MNIRRLDSRQRLDWLRLLRSENVGPVTFRTLINRFGSAERALASLPELSARGGLRRPLRICPHAEAEAEMEAAERLGARLVAWGEPGYPPLLAQAEGMPPLVYASGNLNALERPMVAIVGSRNCSAAGQRLAAVIARGLSDAGIVVVSGLARGIDASAHRASISGGTVAVLAGGHGHIYPPEHVDLAAEIEREGALLSEMPPGWVPRAKEFPRRNRIISGISRGVVVIEAAERSGSLITARRALEQNREVFAVPGSPLDPRAAGTNRLIRDGAALTRSADDVLEVLAPIMGQPPPLHGADEPPAGDMPCGDLNEELRERVHGLLSHAPVEIDDIVRQSGAGSSQVMLALVELELAGRLSRHAGLRVALA